jgi:hypothetical protein
VLTMFRRRWGQVHRLGMKQVAGLLYDRVQGRIVDRYDCVMARLRSTGMTSWGKESEPRRIVPRMDVQDDGACAQWIQHRFDLLGSGPVVPCVSAVEEPDLPRSWRRIAKRLRGLLPSGYQPIAWHRDATGSEWLPSVWSKRITIGQTAGEEVKWPWELSRLQHLPAMAARIGNSDTCSDDDIAQEVRAQIIDFTASNPPCFGVNWVCAMDVGIRAANIALAVDLCRSAGAKWEDEFLRLVSATLRDHGRFLVKNLEWGASLSSNHYLGDIAGLLACGLYLQDKEASDWATFAGREIVIELAKQFHECGSNFEGSTCYHRLSSELMTYSIALMLNTSWRDPEQASRWWCGPTRNYRAGAAPPATSHSRTPSGHQIPFDATLSERIVGMARFIQSIQRHDGTIPIIGDDDSGRFVRLMQRVDPTVDLLDHSHVIAVVGGLFSNLCIPGRETAETKWIRELVGECQLTATSDLKPRRHSEWSEFGLQVWSRPGYQMTLRCGSVGQNENGGHAHSDQLSITLDIGGRPCVIDPGTGVYTPDHAMRNVFRSVQSHNSPIVIDHEPMDWLPGRWGLFMMKDKCRSTVHNADDDGGSFSHCGYGPVIRRTLTLSDSTIQVVDDVRELNGQVYGQLVLAADVVPVSAGDETIMLHGPDHTPIARVRAAGASCHMVPWSPRYGVVAETQAIRYTPTAGVMSVEICPL